jgi:uncharacterized protein (DUF362 family)
MPVVSVVKCKEDEIDKAVSEAVDLVDGLEIIRNKRNISIKPNLCTLKSSSSGATTSLQVVESLVRKIQSVNPNKINIVETNNSKADAERTFRYLGYDAIAQTCENVQCVSLSKDSKLRVDVDGRAFSSLIVPESMVFSDCLISVAKLKTHVDYYYTGVLKNQYGLLLGRRDQYHGFVSKIIVDLNRFYKPDLSIIDGLVGMEGFGPIGGTPRNVGVIIASKDPVAADAVGAKIIGIQPSKIGYLKYAEKKGVGTMKNIKVVGCDVSEVATSFRFISARNYYLSKVALALQRYSRYIMNMAEFVRLARSASATLGISAIEKRMSYRGLWRMAADTLTKLE